MRDGRSPLPELESPAPLHLNQTSYSVLPPGPVVLRAFRKPKAVHLAAVVESGSQTKFVPYVSEGSVLSMGPTILPRCPCLSIYAHPFSY